MPNVLLDAVSTETNSEAAAELIHRVLSRSDHPQSLSQILREIPQAARPPEDAAEAVLQMGTAAGRLFEFPPLRGKLLFWHQSPADYARRRLLQTLERGPRTQSELLGPIGKLSALKDLSKTELKRIFDQLQQDGTVHKLPAYLGARTSLFSTQLSKPAHYVENALQKLSRKLNIPAATLIQELVDQQPSADPQDPRSLRDERIIDAMKELNPAVATGAMIAIADLRRQLDAHLSGTEFDRELLKEVVAQRLAIHPFDRPHLVSEQERSLLLRDSQGQYFNTVSLRRN